ncbi:MAG: oligosaccharide flippase family protein [Candidatus Hydrogenedentes bacterium]|nr:oligosaccharide flippase family protein [Candidatus Hydrogenedentota bacterium]
MLLGGQALGQACSFARNVVVARLLTPEDFGIAATFVIAVSLFEMISNLAVDRLLVQAEDGDDPDFQATAHAFQVVRGIGMALFLFLLAWPFSRLFGIPQALWAFQFVALVPLLRGFMHLDPKRLQRTFGFGADVATELLPQILLVLAAWPFVWWFEDYSAMLWLLVFQAVVMVVVSHALAKRSYGWNWDRNYIRRMVAFGWPLLFNGLLMFLVFQGDRMIVGAAYDMTQLGVYSVAFTTTFVPTMVITKVASALLLPLLSRVQTDIRSFMEYYALSVCALCLIGVAFSTGFVLLGQQVVVLTFGERYGAVGSFIGWLGVMQMIRVLRVGPTIASMAWGDTRMPLVSNFGRISVIPLAIWLGLTGKPLMWVVIAGCLGELVALLLMIGILHRSRALMAGHTLKPMLIGAGAVTIAFALSLSAEHHYSLIVAVTGLVVIVVGAFVAMVCYIPFCRPHVRSLVRSHMPQPGQK